MSNPPTIFPLKPQDYAGNPVRLGDTVRIIEIPEWLIHDLPKEEALAITACIGSKMVVNEIDNNGFFWVTIIDSDTKDEYQAQSFAMEPRNVLKI
jgi:hypothetical protein